MPEPQDAQHSSEPPDEFNDIIETIKVPAKSRSARQGLPAEYRMRHDAHYVEELATQVRPAAGDPSAATSGVPMPAALKDLCQEFEGLASCFNLLDQGARPLRERLGLSLAKVGVQRSIRYAQNLRFLLDEPSVLHRDMRLDDLIRHAFGDFKEELRLTETNLVLELPSSPLLLQGDQILLRTALRACAGTTIALVEMGGVPSTIHVSAFASDEVLHCEFRQDTYMVEPQQLVRMFELESSERSAGRAIAVALNVARRVSQIHGGQFQARRTSSGGCAFLFSLPKIAADDLSATPN